MKPHCTPISPCLSYCAIVLENTYTTYLVPQYNKQNESNRIVFNVKHRGHTPVISLCEIIEYLPNNSFASRYIYV